MHDEFTLEARASKDEEAESVAAEDHWGSGPRGGGEEDRRLRMMKLGVEDHLGFGPTTGCSEDRGGVAEQYVAEERLLQDGGGINSTADWGIPRGDKDVFKLLRDKWSQRAVAWNLGSRLQKHLVECKRCRQSVKGKQRQKPGNLFSPGEISVLRKDMVTFLREAGHMCTEEVAEGQPFTLQIWKAMLEMIGDIDAGLPSILEQGVPTGIDGAVPASGVWRPRDADERPDLELLVHTSPWKSGSDDIHGLRKLLKHDEDLGFCEMLQGGFKEAQRRFGKRMAAGKLGIVKAPGKDDRLVGDSSVSGANARSCIEEKVELPGLSDLQEFLSRHPEPWTAFSLDVSAAHKRVKVLESEQGYNLFAVKLDSGETEWWVYKTCHFGASWSAYWWARTAAAYVRLMHHFLWVSHGLLMYVDDALFMFKSSVAPLMALWALMLTVALGGPLSWHKLQLDERLNWIGWDLDFSETCPTANLTEGKKERLLEALGPLCSTDKKVDAKQLEKTIGLLGWWTAGAFWLRPWLQPLYCLLHRPCVKFQWMDAEALQELRQLCDDKIRAVQDMSLSDVRQGWQVYKVGSHEVKKAEDLSRVGLKNNGAWVTFWDFDSEWLRVDSETAHAATLFWNAVFVQQSIPLVVPRTFGGVAAADAFAEGEWAGIGGWMLPPGAELQPENIIWYAEEIHINDLPSWFRSCCGKEDLQAYISSFEAMGQLALLELRCHEDEEAQEAGAVGLRQRCDNQGVVAASAKALSMKKPLCYVLQAMGFAACEKGIQLRITHIAGNRNDWADALSRGREKDEAFWRRLKQSNRRRIDIWQLLEEPWHW